MSEEAVPEVFPPVIESELSDGTNNSRMLISVAVLAVTFIIAGVVFVMQRKKSAAAAASKKSGMLDNSNSVAQSDVSYLATYLRPDSTHLDILFYIATAPESIQMTQDAIDKVDVIKAARLEFLNGSKKNDQEFDFESDGDDDGWANDDDGDEASKAAKAKQAEKEKLAKEVAEASGTEQIAKNIKMEGVDDGVLGQEWVEKTLSAMGQWPPNFDKSCAVGNMTFAQKGKGAVPALEHSAVRRNLCMTLGRLNAIQLNSNEELRK